MKEIFCLILMLCSILGPHKRSKPANLPIIWDQTKEWKLYYTQSKEAFALPLDSLRGIKSIDFEQDSISLFLRGVTEIPTERAPVWMGYFVCSCKLPDGKLLKIEVSQYGRFFFEEGERRYFQLNRSVQDSWQNYLNAKWMQLESISK